jgi:hypothetical protein
MHNRSFSDGQLVVIGPFSQPRRTLVSVHIVVFYSGRMSTQRRAESQVGQLWAKGVKFPRARLDAAWQAGCAVCEWTVGPEFAAGPILL